MMTDSIETNFSGFNSRLTAYCKANSFHISKLIESLRSKEVHYTEYRKGAGVIHRKHGLHDGDVFYFPYGTVVMWGLSVEEERDITTELKEFVEDSDDSLDIETYHYAIGSTLKVTDGKITLPSNDVLTKLAISHGFAQSVKLGTFEKRIESRIAKTKPLSDKLAQKGRIPLRRREITKMQGKVFSDRSLVNLHSDILDTPEFFWEHSELEPLYNMVANDLDIRARVSVLNKRMDILKELFDMLGDELHARHSSFLELTIVFLITVEIVLFLSMELLPKL